MMMQGKQFTQAKDPHYKLNSSLGFIDTNPISVQEVVNSSMRRTQNKSLWGIEGYKLPDTSLITLRPKTTKILPFKQPHFIEQITKAKEYIPGPQYDVITNWKEILKEKNRFTKSPRITFTESIIQETKLRGTPAPGVYDHKSYIGGLKSEKAKTDKTEKVCAFIEEAKYRGSSTPAHKYEVKFVRIFHKLIVFLESA